MNDLIDRQAANDAIQIGWDYTNNQIRALQKLPSAQPEIIRCKDCKKNPRVQWYGCPMAGKGTRKDDDFCSYAERREE